MTTTARRRGPQTKGRDLSPVETEVLALFNTGLSRHDAAVARGVSCAAITHVCKRLERKGYDLPPRREGGFHEPVANARVAPYLGRGLTDRDIAARLGVTHQRVGQVRRRINRTESHHEA